MPKRIRVSAPDAFSRPRPKPKSIISCGWRCSRKSPCGSSARRTGGTPILTSRESAADRRSRHRPVRRGGGAPGRAASFWSPGPPAAGARPAPAGPARLLSDREPLAARQFLVQQRRLAPELLDRLPSPCVDALKHAVGLAPADALRAWPVDDPRDLVLGGGAHRQDRHAEARRWAPPAPEAPGAPGAPERASESKKRLKSRSSPSIASRKSRSPVRNVLEIIAFCVAIMAAWSTSSAPTSLS